MVHYERSIRQRATGTSVIGMHGQSAYTSNDSHATRHACRANCVWFGSIEVKSVSERYTRHITRSCKDTCLLQSNVKGTDKGYPLIIEADEVVLEESPMDTDLLLKLIPKLDYAVILGAVRQLSESTTTITTANGTPLELPELPSVLPTVDGDELRNDTQLLSNLHTVLMDVHILEGNLVCPDTGRKFPVKEGIPNMILHEDEV